MKKNITYLCMAAAALLASSCTQNEEITPTMENEGRVPVQFSANLGNYVEIDTKTLDDTWGSLAKIAISMYDTEGELLDEAPYRVSYDSSSGEAESSSATFVPDSNNDILYFPIDGSNVTFKACSPNENFNDGLWEADLSDQSNGIPLYFDLMTTTASSNEKTYNETTPSVSLDFEHRLAYLTLVVSKGEGFDGGSNDNLRGLQVTLTDQKTKVSYNLSTDALTIEETPGSIKMSCTSPNQSRYNPMHVSAIVCPGTVSADSKLVFALGEETFTTDLPAESFTAGSKLTYNVTLNRYKAEANVTATITGKWNVEEGEDIEITEEPATTEEP